MNRIGIKQHRNFKEAFYSLLRMHSGHDTSLAMECSIVRWKYFEG